MPCVDVVLAHVALLHRVVLVQLNHAFSARFSESLSRFHACNPCETANTSRAREGLCCAVSNGMIHTL
jgi:hypothetical protein